MRPSTKGHTIRSSRTPRASRRPRRSLRHTEFDDEDAMIDPPPACRCENCKLQNRPSIDHNSPLFHRKVRQVMSAIDNQTGKIFDELENFVALRTISSDENEIPDCLRGLDNVRERLARMKFSVNETVVQVHRSICKTGPQHRVLFGEYFSSPTKSTMLIYGYLDVHKADKKDGWLRDPFEMIVKDDVLYGRGVATGKGMLVCWLNAIEAWLKEYEDLPINVKIIVETLNEVGSRGLLDCIEMKKDFFLDVDCIVFGNNSWLNDDHPVLSCSLAGWAYFGVEVQGAKKHLEGGLAGGLVYEPMTDICQLMNSLVNDMQEVQIPGINHLVKPVLHHEWDLMESSNFSEYDYKENHGIRRLRYELSKAELLEHRWCRPNLTMHGIEGCFSRPGSSTIMPMTVMGKFSIKLVPEQDLHYVQAYVDEYLFAQHAEQKMGTDLSVELLDSCEPFNWRFDSKYTKAAFRAIERAYQVEPVLVSGIVTCMPIASLLRQQLGKSIILLPYTQRQDSSQLINESISSHCFINYAKCCAALMHELSVLPVKCKCDVIYEYCNRRGVAEVLEAARTTSEPFTLPKRKTLMQLSKPKVHRETKPEQAPKKSSLKKFLRSFQSKKKPERTSQSSDQS